MSLEDGLPGIIAVMIDGEKFIRFSDVKNIVNKILWYGEVKEQRERIIAELDIKNDRI